MYGLQFLPMNSLFTALNSFNDILASFSAIYSAMKIFGKYSREFLYDLQFFAVNSFITEFTAFNGKNVASVHRIHLNSYIFGAF